MSILRAVTAYRGLYIYTNIVDCTDQADKDFAHALFTPLRMCVFYEHPMLSTNIQR